MNLIKSRVEFDADEHRYWLDCRELSGITSLIHSVLGLGVYPDASEYTRDFIIPRAGSRGTAVHQAIRIYDETGFFEPLQQVKTRQGRDYEIMEWDVTSQLESYIFYRDSDFEPLANEFTVSDNVRYASQIDNVWRRKSTGGIWLADTKTNNLRYYPLCGYGCPDYFLTSEEALREYLSWQLSIYAELFEKQTGLKVEGLCCNWLTEDESDFWIIERKPSELVWKLLDVEWTEICGNRIYLHTNPALFCDKEFLPAQVEEQTPIIAPDVVKYMTDLLLTRREAEAKLNEAKTALKAAMQEHGVKKYDFGSFSATMSKGGMTKRFDTARFKKEFPDLYDQYCKESESKGSLTIKLKEDE